MLTLAQIEEYEAIFKIVDLNGDGSVTKQELEKVLVEKYGHKLNSRVIKSFIRRLASSGNEQLTFNDFVTSAIVHDLTKEKDDDTLVRKMFDLLDTDGNGHISVDEILVVFKKQDLSEVLIEQISKEITSDMNKDIDFEVFRSFIKAPTSICNTPRTPHTPNTGCIPKEATTPNTPLKIFR